ncbi:MAG: TIGR04053 family radical SAM/SPASM domain-containing protein [Actinomycetota bacterium]
MRPAAQQARSDRDARLAAWDLDEAPFTIAWEVTRACPYTCVHCRADAQPYPDPNELSTEEARRLITELARFGPCILVLTGGDPMARRDLEDIVAAAHASGLKVALTPSATARVTRRRIQGLRDAGVRRVALSVDAPSASAHDAFRGLPGSFARTRAIANMLGEEGVPLQINTTIARHLAGGLTEMASTVESFTPVQWSLFFLVQTGRGSVLEMLTPDEHERFFDWIATYAQTATFDVKVTEAPAYRRVLAQAGRRREGVGPATGTVAGAGFRFADGLNRPALGIGDGKGFMFISHTGDVTPSGFLPLPAGNVRKRSPVDIYREAPLFRALRAPDLLEGRCGQCEYRQLCGGSRARAYAATWNPLAEDPSCAYVPEGMQA